MKKLLQLLASVYFWFEFAVISAILFPISLLIYIFTVFFDKRLFILHKFTCLWSFIVLSINPLWRIKVSGREKINPKKVYIMVSNHQSGADIIVLFLLWAHFKWVAKKSLFYYPFIGWNMFLNRYIALERGKSSSMRKMMADAARTLAEGNSLMIFPEGTRSKNGQIQPFKTGAFHLAIDNQIPVLPIAIQGTSQAIRKGGFLINKNFNIYAKVLDPIPYESMKGKNMKEVASCIHNIIEDSLKNG